MEKKQIYSHPDLASLATDFAQILLDAGGAEQFVRFFDRITFVPYVTVLPHFWLYINVHFDIADEVIQSFAMHVRTPLFIYHVEEEGMHLITYGKIRQKRSRRNSEEV